MGRVLVASACMLLACGFAPGRLTGADAPGSVDGAAAADGSHADSAAPQDGPMLQMNGSACSGAVWHADFSVDPTTIDGNGDGIADFAVRTGGGLPGSLGSGVWTVPASSAPLDTQPKQPFTTRVVLDVTMQSVTRGATHGAVAWINTAYGSATFAPLFLDLQRDSNEAESQTLTVFGKMGSNAVESQIDAFSVGDDDLHHFHVDIDPTALTYHLVMDGGVQDRGSKSYYAIPLAGSDQWATVVAYGGDSVFDDFQIEVCPP
ncbi:MAG TPA: hypothetical protein VGL61_02055 [Kofleriaceae bacterium]